MIEARIRFFSGPNMRSKPINNGYRPHFKFKDGFRTSGEILLQKGEIFLPGEEHIVQVNLLRGTQAKQRIEVGTKFTIHESENALGGGEVITFSIVD